MIIGREFEALLRASGLDDFDAVMHFTGGEVVKQKIKERSTVRFQVGEGKGETWLYLKRYRSPALAGMVKSALTFSKTYSAIYEWRSIHAFQACGLPSVTPIAVGMRRRESFLLTLGLTETRTLEQEAREHYTAPHDKATMKRKRDLIRSVALLTGRMHACGFKHQDFYLCHLLIAGADSAHPDLYIADLHRTRRRRNATWNWKIKDLASLNYSAPAGAFSRADRLRFLKAYDAVLAGDRSFIRAVVRKTERIRTHTERNGG
jgi:heptose I phosphotransferase